jgi:hypothetical protein
MEIINNIYIFVTLQILAALIIVFVLYIITLLVLNTDSLVVLTNARVKQKEKVSIFTGSASANRLSGKEYNTIAPFAPNFKKIAKSLNSYGGAQFSYQFWMKINDTDSTKYNDVIILLKGVNNKYKKALYDPTTFNKINGSETPADYMIKCPCIKFGTSYQNLIIEFNTNNDPNSRMSVDIQNQDNTNRKNLLSLLPNNWYLITYVLEDNYSSAIVSENGISVTLYINDFPYKISNASTDSTLKNNYLKINDGNLYLFPNLTSSSEFMNLANMKYYNYALTQPNISATYASGPPKFEMKDDTNNNSTVPAFVSTYNQMDIYNY